MHLCGHRKSILPVVLSPQRALSSAVLRCSAAFNAGWFTYAQQVSYWFPPAFRTARGFLNDNSIPYFKKKILQFQGNALSLLLIGCFTFVWTHSHNEVSVANFCILFSPGPFENLAYFLPLEAARSQDLLLFHQAHRKGKRNSLT